MGSHRPRWWRRNQTANSKRRSGIYGGNIYTPETYGLLDGLPLRFHRCGVGPIELICVIGERERGVGQSLYGHDLGVAEDEVDRSVGLQHGRPRQDMLRRVSRVSKAAVRKPGKAAKQNCGNRQER